jgi:hypothetical protein
MKAPYAHRIETATLAIRIMADIYPEYADSIRDSLKRALAVKNTPLARALKLEELRDQTSRLVFPLGAQK